MSKAPLENIPQERAVIGALLGDTRSFWVHKDRIKPSLFNFSTHIKIAQIMHGLVEAGREISLPAIVGKMPEGDQDWNPAGYLATLIADEGEPEHLLENLADLEDMWGRREMMKLGAELMKQAVEDSGLDALGRLEVARDKMENMHDPMASAVKQVGDIASNVLTYTQEAAQAEKVVGVPVGLKGAQDLLGLLMPGRMYLLAGSSGSGKSALGQQFATFASTPPHSVPTLFFQLEMEAEEMIERDLAARTQIPADRIERAALNDEEMDRLWDAQGEMQPLRFYVDDSTNLTVAQMRAKAMRMKRLKGLGLVVVDHLLLVAVADKRKGEFDGLRANLQALKRMAKDLGVPVLVLTQLKGSYQDGTWQNVRPPSINDIFGGSSNEHDPDAILFVYREEYLLKRKEPAESDKTRADWAARVDQAEGKAQLILAKRRGGKGVGTRTVYFDESRVVFTDTAPRRPAAKQAAFELDPDKTF